MDAHKHIAMLASDERLKQFLKKLCLFINEFPSYQAEIKDFNPEDYYDSGAMVGDDEAIPEEFQIQIDQHTKLNTALYGSAKREILSVRGLIVNKTLLAYYWITNKSYPHQGQPRASDHHYINFSEGFIEKTAYDPEKQTAKLVLPKMTMFLSIFENKEQMEEYQRQDLKEFDDIMQESPYGPLIDFFADFEEMRPLIDETTEALEEKIKFPGKFYRAPE